MDKQVDEILLQVRKSCEECFAPHLVGVYVHGSLALGCFTWEKSDIDFLVVTDAEPTQQEKERFIARLLDIERNGPPKGLEMSVVLEKDCRTFVYPTPFVLHYSDMHKKACETQLAEYCGYMKGEDKDLAAHFTVIRHAGITLCGKPIAEVFGPVPKADYLDSIRCDIEEAREDILTNTMYMILTLCRVLAYKRDELVLSKKQGGEWGLANLPAQYAGILHAALESYAGDRPFVCTADEKLLSEYADEMLTRIYEE